MPVTENYPIREFLNYLTFQKRYSRHTIISYENDLAGFFDFVVLQYNSLELAEISSSIVRSWLASLKEDKIASKSINRKISTLKSFFKYQLKMNKIEVNPVSAIVSLKISKRLPSFVAQKDLKTLFNDTEFPDTWEGKTNRLLLLIFYQTGIRLSELINIKESHIDKSNGAIKVLGKGNKERIIPVNNALLREIDSYNAGKNFLSGDTQKSFLLINKKGKKLYPKYVYNVVKKCLGDVSTNERKSPHVLRHSFATHLTNNGADINAIKELLGHASLASTQIYTHNSIDKLKEVHKLAHPKS
ncbi:tyrosine-type recombinase/integrase [Ginsengibacter hankyongi]|uniref:Tyrosine-type recombinase/integrase n=1 Tax=Ginsengibacter hankyongi TaxID=2607284 RepID=A0A5J5ILW8_9BACT|nr:tyrosine-type recombinase/integrase [Ginsengibacter hankyongi]KAA9041498.1 tyrosine-type recombinase/integrase [Ginsengibacter hankyongi]